MRQFKATALVLLAAIMAGSCTAFPVAGRYPPGTQPPSQQPSQQPSPKPAPPSSSTTVSGPIWAASWSPVPDDVKHITPMIWIRPSTRPEDAAKESRTRPQGRAVAILWLRDREVATHVRDRVRRPDGTPTDIAGPWFDHGIARVRDEMHQYFSEFKQARGHLDYLVLDFEISRSIWAFDVDVREQSIRAILDDPRAREIRDELMRRGVREDQFGIIHDFRQSAPTFRLGTSNLTEILHREKPPYIVWNVLMGERITEAIHEAIFEPVRSIYPHLKGSNYGHFSLTPENVVPDVNGHLHYRTRHFGTHNSRSFYGIINNMSRVRLANGKQYGNAPFDVLRWQVNMFRAIQRSSDVPFHAWVSHKALSSSSFRDNGYYEELMYHLALCGTETFLYWHPLGSGVTPEHGVQARILDRCLVELNRWFDDRTRTTETLQELPWESELVVSGTTIGNSLTLWRISTPPGTRHVRVEQTGEILKLHEGSVGVWYETDAGASPTFTIVDAR